MVQIIQYDTNGNKIKREMTDDELAELAPSLEGMIAEINAWVDEFTAPLTAFAPEQEQKSWPGKAAAARAFLAGVATEGQLAILQAETAFTGETTESLARVIVAEADRFETVTAMIAGLRRRLTAELRAETDPYRYNEILDAGKAIAISEAKELGLDLGG